jgi:homoserine O-succinyltransferase
MPLIRNSDLPTYDRLRDEGRQILDPDRASHQDIRELHIGFLNLMPDAALEATERQFFRLLDESNMIVQIHVHPFTLPMIERGAAAKAHIEKHYEDFDKLKEEGLDAIIVTGANVSTPVSDKEFWQPMIDVVNWGHKNTTSVLCSCFASHIAVTHGFRQPPTRHNDKRWGVFRHRVIDKMHPLVGSMNTLFDAPHSRFGDISRAQFEDAGMRVLVESPHVGVHMATSNDGFRLICFQGHPEYDVFSLLKEYRREVTRFMNGERPDYPPLPDNYFNDEAESVAIEFKKQALLGKNNAADFPEEEISNILDNTWVDSARSVMGKWIGLVYQVTHVDRQKQFMDGIDPENPLGLAK